MKDELLYLRTFQIQGRGNTPKVADPQERPEKTAKKEEEFHFPDTNHSQRGCDTSRDTPWGTRYPFLLTGGPRRPPRDSKAQEPKTKSGRGPPPALEENEGRRLVKLGATEVGDCLHTNRRTEALECKRSRSGLFEEEKKVKKDTRI